MREHQLSVLHDVLAFGVELVELLSLLNHLFAFDDELLVLLVKLLGTSKKFVNFEKCKTLFQLFYFFVVGQVVLKCIALIICFLDEVVSDSITVLLFLINHVGKLTVHGIAQWHTQFPTSHPWSSLNFLN